MKNFKTQSTGKSREKREVHGQTFRIPIWSGLFEHYQKIKDAIWLFLLFIDWTTEERFGREEVAPDEEDAAVQPDDVGGPDVLYGIVRGGIPIPDAITAQRIHGASPRTTQRWRNRLALRGLILQDRKSLGYVILLPRSKKWYADGAEGGFRIPVSTGILDHYKRMGESIWLFLWYIDKTTFEENGQGKVLGGKPISDSEPAKVFGVPESTIAGWRKNLNRWGYVRTTRTPFGHTVVVAKSKKWVSNNPPSECAKRELVNAQNVRSLTEKVQNQSPVIARSERCDCAFDEVRMRVSRGVNAQNVRNKEDITETGQRQNRGQDSASAPPPFERNSSEEETATRTPISLASLAKEKTMPWEQTARERDERRRLLLKQGEEVRARYAANGNGSGRVVAIGP
jgi:hypothetical protein